MKRRGILTILYRSAKTDLVCASDAWRLDALTTLAAGMCRIVFGMAEQA
jgi:hypothetical protein